MGSWGTPQAKYDTKKVESSFNRNVDKTYTNPYIHADIE